MWGAHRTKIKCSRFLCPPIFTAQVHRECHSMAVTVINAAWGLLCKPPHVLYYRFNKIMGFYVGSDWNRQVHKSLKRRTPHMLLNPFNNCFFTRSALRKHMISSSGQDWEFWLGLKLGASTVCMSCISLLKIHSIMVYWLYCCKLHSSFSNIWALRITKANSSVAQFFSKPLETGWHLVHCKLYEFLETAALTWMK